ncbi:non-canonical purine NTP pyrophosphatase, RdgB/HAM1 family [Desulfuribacillus stibiiarsenatis]|uniref:dITP/XTP pyrophosphatase n=1 Tax=Desulfuribacillus stibiiarsenatis TaxID=1390249 RepID=A0A1E5L216_9FIRM|nr:XTP/dITP diphosphatase [Desulfuribacillus stibiiarsenatis]OEH84175.1 non-canonical purine NTP pyrophosphatase, RdgB/HAM1 family [Desulfuribacillus stibiiarsenatis]
MKVVLATKNKGKVKEFNHYLGHLGWTVVSMDEYPEIPEIIEDGLTFEANAVKKAVTVMQATGLPTLADDSGITVDVLDGRPGVYSARFAGHNAQDEENNQTLLRELSDVPDEQRTASFVCCIAYIAPDMDEALTFQGECKGVVLKAPQGGQGFGYDPLFFVPTEGKTMAELGVERKNEISHRAMALLEMKNFFQKH